MTLFLPATAIIWSQQRSRRRVRILAAHDPLRNVPRGSFRLEDFSFGILSQHEFGNCALRSSGVA